MGENPEKEIKCLKEKYGFTEPDRGDLDDPTIKWRHGKPVYVKANLAYLKGKSKDHHVDSLERLVENLVKTWEMEASHKIDYSQWNTIDRDAYKVSANGAEEFVGEDCIAKGNYNVLLAGVNKEFYNYKKETFDSSHDLFRGTFKDGFPWEVLQVFSGPPKVTFSWRHWGIFNGEYRERQGDGQTYDMYGFCEVVLNEQLKVQSIEVYYKPEEFLKALEGKLSPDELKGGKTVMGSGCPIVHYKT